MDEVFIVLFDDWNDETEIIRVYSDYDSAMCFLNSLKKSVKYNCGHLHVDTFKVH